MNVHHFAKQVIAYLAEHNNFGMEIAISHEHELLDTGGGLKNAAWFFANSGGPFLLHNVDILSDFDLPAMLAQHCDTNALATLAVQARSNNRPLLFNGQGLLRGYCPPGQPDVLVPQKACVPQPLRPLAFAGIHVVSPRIFSMFAEQNAFSIIPAYLRMAAAGEAMIAFQQDDAYWRDLGTADSLQQAAADLAARPGLLAGLAK